MICNPSTRKVVERTRARVSVKGSVPAHWIVSWISFASETSSITRPSPATASRKRVETTASSQRGGSWPASTP